MDKQQQESRNFSSMKRQHREIMDIEPSSPQNVHLTKRSFQRRKRPKFQRRFSVIKNTTSSSTLIGLESMISSMDFAVKDIDGNSQEICKHLMNKHNAIKESISRELSISSTTSTSTSCSSTFTMNETFEDPIVF